MFHFIKTFDFYGPQINFTIRKQPNFQTVAGGLLSITTYTCYLLFFLLFCGDLVFKQNPNVIEETITPLKYTNSTLPKDFFIAWRLEDYYGRKIEVPDFLQIKVSTRSFRMDKISAPVFLNFTSCESQSFQKNFENTYFTAKDLNCIDFAQAEDFKLGGNYYTEYMGFIAFEIDRCHYNKNSTPNGNCLADEKVKNFLQAQNVLIAILYNEVVFNPNEFETPLVYTVNRLLNVINFNTVKYDILSLRETVVQQDSGFLFSEETEIAKKIGGVSVSNYAMFKSDEERSKSRNVIFENNFYSLNILFDHTFKNFSRKYLKVQDVLGNVNGIMELLVFAFNLVNYYANYRLDYFLFNECVRVCDDKSSKADKIQLNFDFKNRIKFNENVNVKNKNDDDGKFDFLELDKISEINNDRLYKVKCGKDKKKLEINKRNGNKHEINNDLQSGQRKNFIDDNLRLKRNVSNRKDFDKEFRTEPLSENKNLNNDFKNFKNISNAKDDFLVQSSNRYLIQDKLLNSKVKNDLNKSNLIPDAEKENKTKSLLLNLIKNLNIDNKKRHLNPNFFNYYFHKCCFLCIKDKTKNKNKNITNSNSLFEYNLLEKYLGKINEKIDIFYYFKLIKIVKYLKKLMIEVKEERFMINALSMNLHNCKMQDSQENNQLKDKDELKINYDDLFTYLKKEKFMRANSILKNESFVALLMEEYKN